MGTRRIYFVTIYIYVWGLISQNNMTMMSVFKIKGINQFLLQKKCISFSAQANPLCTIENKQNFSLRISFAMQSCNSNYVEILSDITRNRHLLILQYCLLKLTYGRSNYVMTKKDKLANYLLLESIPSTCLYCSLSPHVESKIKNLCSSTYLSGSSKTQNATVTFYK